MRIVHATARPTEQGPVEQFTGDVWLDELGVTAPPSRLRVHLVTFAPGARTAWHTHPLGQVLHVAHGVGRVQRDGEPIREIQAGDTVYVEPGERHWHGAAPDHTMGHLAVQEAAGDGGEATWGDHVSDADYR